MNLGALRSRGRSNAGCAGAVRVSDVRVCGESGIYSAQKNGTVIG